MHEPNHPLDSVFKINLAFHHIGKEAEKTTGLTIVQWYVLKRLQERPATSAQDLAQSVGVHPSSLTQSLKRLSRKGLLFVAEDPRDSRRKVISITRRGKEVLDSADADMRKLGEELRPVRAELLLIENRLARRKV